MTKLSCTAQNCMYNKEDCCCKPDITVEGQGASTTEETCCGSFQGKCCHGGTNAMDHVNEKVDIQCEASSCMYNDEKRCTAGNIGIVGRNASHSEETECGSFKMR